MNPYMSKLVTAWSHVRNAFEVAQAASKVAKAAMLATREAAKRPDNAAWERAVYVWEAAKKAQNEAWAVYALAWADWDRAKVAIPGGASMSADTMKLVTALCLARASANEALAEATAAAKALEAADEAWRVVGVAEIEAEWHLECALAEMASY